MFICLTKENQDSSTKLHGYLNLRLGNFTFPHNPLFNNFNIPTPAPITGLYTHLDPLGILVIAPKH